MHLILTRVYNYGNDMVSLVQMLHRKAKHAFYIDAASCPFPALPRGHDGEWHGQHLFSNPKEFGSRAIDTRTLFNESNLVSTGPLPRTKQ